MAVDRNEIPTVSDDDPMNVPIVPPAELEAFEKNASDRSQATTFQERWKKRFPHGVNWSVAGWMVMMHVGAISAFWFFTWAGLITFLILHFVTSCLGITLCYHRLLTHGSFKVPRLVKYFFSFCGIMTGEGSPAFWVATHRKHHALSDQEGDPHSPRDGFWWSHLFWMQPKRTSEEIKGMLTRWAPDIWKDPFQRLIHHTYAITLFATAIPIYLIGEYLVGGAGISMLLWGFCMRMVVVYHGTWFVNSATHVWGYRTYKTRDDSKNLWWVGLLAYGEGWHNNHHAFQRLARYGHRWWELDITYGVIWILKKLRIASAVQDQLPSR